jgi:CRISPR-associated protein Cmr1
MPKLSDIPVCPDPPAVRSSGRVTKEYKISLVTPLFGGGVEAGTSDESLPIRGASIRGQLQFWWRATRGSGFSDREQLFARHAEIWGTTDRASPVETYVRGMTAKPVRPCARYEWNQQARGGRGGWRLVWETPFASSPLPYALFPFQGKQPASRNEAPEEPPAEFIETVSFTLRLQYPEELGEDIETAVWAWVNFGGLGARTRRGCGALLCKEFAPNDVNEFDRWFKSASFNSASDALAWPTMPSGVLVGNQAQAPIDAWKKSISLLQAFRQGKGVGRNPGQQHNRPGRSRWPEPETIRRVTGRRSSQHARLAHVPDDAFPRAEFGLPIVFHFQGQGQGEPPDTVLYPSSLPDGEARERMASPLVLKPLALADGKAVPLIMRLAAPPLTGVDLRQSSSSLNLPPSTVTQAGRLATYRDSPVASSSTGSAVEAFLQHARNNGFHEIKR